MKKISILFVLMLSLLVFQGASITEAKDDIPSADLLVTQTDSPDPATVGESISYVIRVENLGPLDAHGVVLTRMELS